VLQNLTFGNIYDGKNLLIVAAYQTSGTVIVKSIY